MFRDGEVFDCIGRHHDDAARWIEVAVGLAGNEELGTGVDGKNAVKFFL